MAKPKKIKYHRLIRYLKPGQRIKVLGTRGKPTKTVKSGRKYLIQVLQGNRVIGYSNNMVKGVPQARVFSLSMIARMKHAVSMNVRQAPQSVYSFNVHNRDYLKNQIPEQVYTLIKQHKGEAFGFRITIKRGQGLDPERFVTPFIYSDGRLKREYLENLVISNLVMTFNMNNRRLSPLAEGMDDLAKTRRIEGAVIDLQFTPVEFKKKTKTKTKKGVKKSLHGKNNSKSGSKVSNFRDKIRGRYGKNLSSRKNKSKFSLKN